jgi:hypothetical protein
MKFSLSFANSTDCQRTPELSLAIVKITRILLYQLIIEHAACMFIDKYQVLLVLI